MLLAPNVYGAFVVGKITIGLSGCVEYYATINISSCRVKVVLNVNSSIGLAQKLLGRSRNAVRVAVKIRNQCNGIIACHVSSGRELEHNGELWMIETVAPHSSYFVDVGANVGNWAHAFATRMIGEPRGLLFEPSPEAASALRSRFGTAGRHGLEIAESAVSDKIGYASFFQEPSMGETSSLVAAHSAPDATKIRVRITSLDEELATRKIPVVDFLKIDAEGFDLHVLRGAAEHIRQRRIAVIQFEYNAPWMMAGSTLTAAYTLLESSGYKVFLLKKEGLFEFGPSVFGEFFSYSNFVAYCPSKAAQGLDVVKRKL